jgi:predicted enzyme related to lactoylglutathione lyase
MPRVVHFDIAADEPERAIRFYESVFGWEIQKWEGPFDYWLIMTGPEDEPGIDGGLGKRDRPDEHTTNTIGVDSVDDYVAKVQESGGLVTMPKSAVPGVGYLAICADTEGNVFSLMEEDPTAQ